MFMKMSHRSLLVAVTLTVGFAACSPRKNKYETVDPRTGGKQTTPAPGAGATVTPPDTTNGGATIRAEFSDPKIVQYIDGNSEIGYKFTYLSATPKEGKIKFANNRGSLEIKGLEVGKSGLMTLELLENNVVRLRGTNTVTLTTGANSVTLNMVDVGDADLVITVEIKSSTPPTGVFATKVQPIVAAKCATAACHGGTQLPTGLAIEATFKEKGAKIYLAVNSGRMPKNGTLTAAERADLLAFAAERKAVFDAQIAPIIKESCVSCHSGRTSNKLDTLDGFDAYRDATFTKVDDASMPKGATLSAEKKKLVLDFAKKL